MSTTGNFVDAQTALTWGLVNHVVPHEELLGFCRELGAAMASVDQPSLRRMRATYDEIMLVPGAAAWAYEKQISDEWMAQFDREAFAQRSGSIMARGRSQL
jgi:enoyl-CoA hydratase